MVLGILYRRRENPGRMGRAVCLAALLLNLFVLLQFRPRQQLTVCFLDVGQGDGIYLQTESGACYFMDGGSTSEKKVGEYRILSFLKCRGADHVDGWFVSHADQAHISGLLEVWESGYRIRRLFLSSYMVKDEAWQELCAMAEAHGTETVSYTHLRAHET